MSIITKIIDLLEKEPMTVREICLSLEIDLKKEKQIYNYLEKISKILKNKGKDLYFIPPKCSNCGYIFNNYKAGKCPRCHSERIIPAKFFIK